MNARILCTNKLIEVEGCEPRTFQFRKLPALTGIKLAKKVITRILPLAKNLLPSGNTSNKREMKDLVGNLDSSILGKIQIEQVAQVLESLSNDDLDEVTRICFTNVSEALPAQLTPVMDGYGNYQVEDVEYDPIMFVTLIWEELKFGLSDFFAGNRWTSLLPKEETPEE